MTQTQQVYPLEMLHPAAPGVRGAIDIHCHANEGQQDALEVAKRASENGMRGIVFKSIVGRDRPVEGVQRVRDALQEWADKEGVKPVECWAGAYRGFPDPKRLREQLDGGVKIFWMPTARSANSLNKDSKTGGRPAMPWEEAVKVGDYLLDDAGKLKPEIRDVIHMIAEYDRAFSFGHASHQEIDALANEVHKISFKKAFVDHPHSPYVDVSVDGMKALAGMGVSINFCYDELSPRLRVDPHKMYDAIRAVGVEHCILSSDGGDPTNPDSVECIRLIRSYMKECGLTDDELRQVSCTNPGFIVGVDPE